MWQTYKAGRQRGQVQQLLVLLKGEKLQREEKEKQAVVVATHIETLTEVIGVTA